MPKYWRKHIFTQVSFPEVGQKQKTEREKERKKEDRKLVITMASYTFQTPPRVAHAKPPGPKQVIIILYDYVCMYCVYTVQNSLHILVILYARCNTATGSKLSKGSEHSCFTWK